MLHVASEGVFEGGAEAITALPHMQCPNLSAPSVKPKPQLCDLMHRQSVMCRKAFQQTMFLFLQQFCLLLMAVSVTARRLLGLNSLRLDETTAEKHAETSIP